jgi:hypothetical protein
MRRVLATGLLLALALALAACSGDADPALVLDGRVRVPDAEGVVDAVSHAQLTLDGRRYRVSSKLQAFSTYTLEATPIAGRRDQYVQVGLDGDTVVWLAAFGAVVRPPGGSDAVYYTGVFQRMDDGRAVFRDGSSVRLGRGVPVPERGTRVQLEIDPVRHEARRLTAV